MKASLWGWWDITGVKRSTQNKTDWTRVDIHTCEVAQAQLPQAVVAVSSVVEEDGQRISTLVQCDASDDPQVLQRQVVELVERHQNVASHFSDGLQNQNKEINLTSITAMQLSPTLALKHILDGTKTMWKQYMLESHFCLGIKQSVLKLKSTITNPEANY